MKVVSLCSRLLSPSLYYGLLLSSFIGSSSFQQLLSFVFLFHSFPLCIINDIRTDYSRQKRKEEARHRYHIEGTKSISFSCSARNKDLKSNLCWLDVGSRYLLCLPSLFSQLNLSSISISIHPHMDWVRDSISACLSSLMHCTANRSAPERSSLEALINLEWRKEGNGKHKPNLYSKYEWNKSAERAPTKVQRERERKKERQQK